MSGLCVILRSSLPFLPRTVTNRTPAQSQEGGVCSELRQSRAQASSCLEGEESWSVFLHWVSLLPCFSLRQGSERWRGTKQRRLLPPPAGEQGRYHLVSPEDAGWEPSVASSLQVLLAMQPSPLDLRGEITGRQAL